MTPYYEHGGITIYHGDCRDVLSEIPDIDILVTDPPYGVNYESGQRDSMGAFGPIVGDGDAAAIVAILALCISRLRESRHAYIFGPLDLSSLTFGGRTELIWDKGSVGMGDLSLPWGASHERISFGVHVKSKKNRADGYGRGAARLRQGTVLRVPRMNSRQNRNHPTEKPVLLLRQLIESSSHIGDTVFDPFAGCGSTLVAASLEARTAIGIEIEERYCEVAAKRLQQEVLPLEQPA